MPISKGFPPVFFTVTAAAGAARISKATADDIAVLKIEIISHSLL
jgi:hypothetical protein